MLFIHVGSPKAASTYLQTVYFKDHPEITYLNTENPEIGQAVIKLSQDPYALTRANFRNEIPADRTAVISDEHFCSIGGRYRIEAIRNLKRLFGDAKIIYIIRNQSDFFASLYGSALQCVDLSPRKFFDLLFLYIPFREVARNLFDFFRTVQEFEEVFGEVIVLPYENMVNDPQQFANRLCKEMSVSQLDLPKGRANQRLTNRHVFAKRYLPRDLWTPFLFNSEHFLAKKPHSRFRNWFWRKWEAFLLNGKRYEIKVPKEIQDFLQRQSAESNKQLSEKYDLKLGELGYFVKSDLPPPPWWT